MTIPRLLWQVWVGPDPIPEQFLDWRAEWVRLHDAGWEHVLVTDTNRPRPLRNEALYVAAESIAPGHEGQFRADLLRYELLAEVGGVYADLDTEPLRPLDPLLMDNPTPFVGWEVQDVWANNAVMGGKAGDAFLRHLVVGLEDSVLDNPGARPSVVSGPRYLTPIARQHPHVRILPQEVFYPYGFAQVGTPAEEGPWPQSTYAVHHWNNTRRGRSRRPRQPQTLTTRRRPR